MKGLAIGTRRQAMLFGTLALLLVFFLVRWSGRSKPSENLPAASVPSVRDPDPRTSRLRRRAATPRPDEIPLLTRRDLEPRVRPGAGDTGRDLFDLREPTKPPPPPPTPAPTLPPMHGPLPPPGPTPTPTPPEPPFKLIGIFGPKDAPIAALMLNEEIVNAREGDVVFSQWIVRNIGYESIDVGFVRFPPSESRRMAISPQ